MKKFLALCIVLVLVLTIALPAMVLADITAGVTGDVPPTPTLSSLSVTSSTPNNSGGATKDISETLTGENFKEGSSFSITISGVGVTADSISWTNATHIAATFHVAAGPTTTAGARDVTVTQSGRTSGAVTFTVNSYISVSAPSAISLGVMTVSGAATTGHSATNGAVDTNAGTYQVVATDQKGTLPGYMNTAPDGSGTKLTNKLQIGKTAGTLFDANNPGVTYNNTTDLAFYVSQTAVAGDTAGSYTITITFAGSTS